MKAHSIFLLALVSLAGSVQSVRAQAPPTPGIATYAGLTLTGPTGRIYAIEATEDLAQIEGWTVVGMVKLKPGPNFWFDVSSPVAGKRFYRAVEPAVQPVANMLFISPGTFVMGSPDTEVGHQISDGPQTQVALTKGFYMGKYEVTQAEYLAVIGSNPSFHQTPVDTSRPVERVDWNQAMAYCAALTTTERAAGRCPADWSYRLPTEAEWEYACRAGSTARYSFGEDEAFLTDFAWYTTNSSDTVHPVGQKAPNAWGLHDLHGNVIEWCLDSWDLTENYPGGSVTDPRLTTGIYRRIRGGGWNYPAESMACASRSYTFPHFTSPSIGFQVTLAPGP